MSAFDVSERALLRAWCDAFMQGRRTAFFTVTREDGSTSEISTTLLPVHYEDWLRGMVER